MPIENAASGPEAGNAGEDAFTKAFEAAVESSSVDEDAYAPAAQTPGAKTEEPVVSESTEDAAKAAPVGKDKAPKVEAPAPTTDIAAPAHWDAQKREAFGALPTPEAKRAMLDLAKGFEADFTRKTTELANDQKFANGIRSLINENHRAQLRSAGMDEVAGIRHLISLNDFATRDPAGYTRWVIEQTGLTPADLFPNFAGAETDAGQQPAQPAPDNQLYAMLNALKQDVDGFRRQNEQQTISQANRSIERFKTEADEGGAQKHPHFDRVRDAMTELLVTPKYQAIEDFGERLQKAYDVAVLMDPDIRTQIVDGDVQKRLKEQEQAANLAKAKKAQAPVKAAPTGAPKTKPGTIDEALTNAMSMHGV